MNNEFKQITDGNEVRYVLEDGGSTTTGAIATVEKPLGELQRRVEPPKPRNFVAKNAKMGGAGQHKDKKKAEKQGSVKHKKPFMEGFNGEYDDEAGMAQSNLLSTARAVMGLLKTIKDKDNLPEWGQEKIAKAEMMLVGVWDYLQSQKQLGNDPQQGVAEAEKKGLYYYVNKRKKAGTSRDASSPKAPSAQSWKDAAKTAKKEGVAEGEYDSRKPFGVRYKVFAGREGRMTTKEYWTTSEEKLQTAVAKIEALDNFYEIDGYSYPKEQQGVAEDPYFNMLERSVSQAQHNLMVGVANNPQFAQKVKVKQQVGQEFAQADQGHDISALPIRVPKKK